MFVCVSVDCMFVCVGVVKDTGEKETLQGMYECSMTIYVMLFLFIFLLSCRVIVFFILLMNFLYIG